MGKDSSPHSGSDQPDEKPWLTSRRSVLSLTGTALAGAALGGVGTAGATAPDDVTITDFGVAAPGVTTQRCKGLGNKAFVTPRGSNPVIVGEFDLEERRVTNNYTFEDGSGSWALCASGDHMYVGTRWPGDVHRIDPEAGTSTRVWKDPLGRGDVWANQLAIWNMDAVDGKVYITTNHEARVYEYDTATGESTDLGRASTENGDARSITATQDTLYVGCGQLDHQLIAIDRQTGEREDILPEEFGDQYPYYIKSTDDHIIVQLLDSYDQLIVDRSDHSNYWIADGMGPPVLDGNTIYHVTHRIDDGTNLYRYDPDARENTLLHAAVPYAHAFIADNGDLVGQNRESLDVIDMDTGEGIQYDLLQSGMQPNALTPQSTGIVEDTPVVSSHGNIHVHHDTGVPEQIEASGEAKRMERVGDTLYMASYPGANINAYQLGDDEAPTVASIGKQQNRPRDAVYQPATGLLLVGTRPDYGLVGGAISAYDVETGDLTVDRNVIQDQSIRAVAVVGDTAVLGSNTTGGGDAGLPDANAKVAGWDPVERTKQWEITPVEGATEIRSLTGVGDLVYGITRGNELFVVDPDDGTILDRKSMDGVGDVVRGPDNMLYAAANPGILQIDPDDLSTTRFAESIHPYAGELAIDGDGDFHLTDRDQHHLYRVNNDIARIEPSATTAEVGERLEFEVVETTGDDRWIDSLEWNMGDGGTASGWWTDHRFDDSGLYTVELTATANDGRTTTHEVEISVGELEDPIARIQPSATEVSAGDRVEFEVEDTSGDERWIDGLEWDLGDGTSATGWWTDHSYSTAGEYTVTLTATDNTGTETTHEIVVSVF